MSVPFLELLPGTREFRAALDAAIARVLDSGWYLLGEELAAFEAAWAAHCGAEHCVAVGSGLDALRFILEGSGIGPGDEVLVPIPPHRQCAYAGAPLADAYLPISDAIAETVVSLPIGPHMSRANVDRVIAAVADF